MVRKIELKDAEAVADICRASLGHETSREQIAGRIKKLNEDGHYYIAVCEGDEDEKIKGFIQAEKYDLLYGGDGWNIIALAAAPDAKGKGAGKTLLNALENLAIERGDSFIRLNSRIERTEAHAFYEHMGYICDKTQKRFIKKLN